MMPFSVIRTWGLGILGWITLGIGIYLVWYWAQQREYAGIRTETKQLGPSVERAENRTTEAGNERSDSVFIRRVTSSARWPYLVWGIGFIAFSWVGYLPILPFLGGWNANRADRHQAVRPRSAQTIFRPDGSRLHVEIFGREHGPTLVMTHGWSLNVTAWTYLLPFLTDKFRIVVWDLPGLGRSTGPTNKDYSLEKMARDLEAVVVEFSAGKEQGPVILIGHSIGGMINQTFCRSFPDHIGTLVQGVVLLHTTYTNPLKTALFAPVWRAIQNPVIVPLNYLNIWLSPLAWLSNVQSYCNGSLHILTRISSFAGRQTLHQLNHGAWLAAAAPPHVLARGNLAMLQFDEQQILPTVDVPVLVIAARDDRMTKPAASYRLDDSLPQSHLAVLKPAGHLGYWEQPEQCAELITEFASKFGQLSGERRRWSKAE
jgi:pimeloyl-ACP methyl ester carboxylesterase